MAQLIWSAPPGVILTGAVLVSALLISALVGAQAFCGCAGAFAVAVLSVPAYALATEGVEMFTFLTGAPFLLLSILALVHRNRPSS